MARKHMLLGDFLLEQGLISEEQLKKALKYQKDTGKLLGRSLIELGFVSEKDVIKALGEQMGVPYISLKNYKIDPSILKLIPEDFARAKKVIPLFEIEDKLTVGMVNPLDVVTLDALARMTKKQIEPVVCHEKDIEEAIGYYYSGKDSLKKAASDFTNLDFEEEDSINEIRLRQQAEETPVVKLVNLILNQAVKDGVSDIHIEPRQKSLSVRYRIDGVLQEVFSPPKEMQLAIASRVKILSSLNIAERRLPQDGRLRTQIDGKPIDFRISTFPTMYGENIVIRVLDQQKMSFRLDDLGMNPVVKEKFLESLHHPHGIILVTGPTGSGKSTTLYASLHELDTPEKNIMTLEDPVEYYIDTIRQAPVNPKIGLTFANGLRSILRQDPDVIMVGEIRDRDTAEIAIQAALTGHLVLSTLHTNNAAGAITRLLDMEIPPYLIASSVICVLAQRLVRKICPACRVPYQPEKGLYANLSLVMEQNPEEVQFYKGNGCQKCKNTGYQGRIGVYELLPFDNFIREMILHRVTTNEIETYAVQNGMQTLFQDSINKAVEGLTTLEEVFRMTHIE
ncbi:MAG: Flp pilus assembly complex ATPase component [Calditrichaeota bacterium]|nr:Flp pilus assembly complex ATPase component [Calditrichota bacterium]